MSRRTTATAVMPRRTAASAVITRTTPATTVQATANRLHQSVNDILITLFAAIVNAIGYISILLLIASYYLFII